LHAHDDRDHQRNANQDASLHCRVFSEAADYEFTTLTCIPGVMHYKGAKVQILDLPGIIEGAKDGKGRGRQVRGRAQVSHGAKCLFVGDIFFLSCVAQVIACARTCDLVMMVLDATKPVTHKLLIEVPFYHTMLAHAKYICTSYDRVTVSKSDSPRTTCAQSQFLTHRNRLAPAESAFHQLFLISIDHE
jgi:hypothetical protein